MLRFQIQTGFLFLQPLIRRVKPRSAGEFQPCLTPPDNSCAKSSNGGSILKNGLYGVAWVLTHGLERNQGIYDSTASLKFNPRLFGSRSADRANLLRGRTRLHFSAPGFPN